MAKDLQNSLHWLEEELLEEDVLPGQDFDWEDILSEFSGEPAPAAPQPQNRAVDFDRIAFDDEDFNDSTAVLVTKKKSKTSAPPAPKKGIRGLVILAILEVIAIIAVLLRWALWFL